MILTEPLSHREHEILQLLANGAADKEIARQLNLSLNTVKWHNRQIYAKLGVSSRNQAVAQAENLDLLGVQEIPVKPVSRIPNNLPAPVSSFVGREREIEEIKSMLETHRLVTLTGPAGVGKTRLALEAARELIELRTYSNGIYFVGLAPVVDPVHVEAAITESLHLEPQAGESPVEFLKRYFDNKKLLLILDNYEHVLEATPLVSELLQDSMNLAVLATSREPLHLYGEQLYFVKPLAANLSQQLFIHRTREVKPNFHPSPTELNLVDQICTSLDHLPLAVELAAARMNIFTLEKLLDSLGDRFQVLTSGPRDVPQRHQTLEAAIDWSYQLLTRQEKYLFNRISVFQEGRTIDAVDYVCCFNLKIDVSDGLRSLLEKNMLQQVEGPFGEPRFVMLVTIKEYSRNNLQKSADLEEIQERHAIYFLNKVQEGDQQFDSDEDRIVWLEQLEADYQNIRVALSWAMTGGHIEIGLRLIGALDDFWLHRGHYQDGKKWIEIGLECIDRVPIEIQAGFFDAAGSVCYFLNQLEKSTEYYEKALVMYQELNEQRKAAYVHIGLIGNEFGKTERDQYVRDHIQKALSILKAIDDKPGLHTALTDFGVCEAFLGNYEEARILFNQALALARETNRKMDESVNLINLSTLDLREGKLLESEQKMKQSLTILRDIDYRSPYLRAGPLAYFACIAVELNQLPKAVTLFSAADALFASRGFKPLPESEPFFDQYQQDLKAIIDQDQFQIAWDIGQTLSPEGAIAFALDEKFPT